MSRFAFISTLLLFLVGCAVLPAPQPTAEPVPTDPPAGPVTRLKLFVSANGIYRVTSADLQQQGAPLDQIDPATLQLFFGDQEIPIRAQGDRAQWSFLFYGQAVDSLYSNFNVYWLTWGNAPGARIGEMPAASARGAPKESFTSTLHLEQPTLYNSQFGEPNAPWFWQTLVAPMTTTITATLANPFTATAQVRVKLWSATQDNAVPDHHLRLFFNDARAADETWDGQGARIVTATIPAASVRAGVNSLRLVAPGDTSAQVEIVLLSSIDITYTRKFVAQADALEFSGNAGTYRVEGFSGDAIDLYDITNPAAPMLLTNLALGGRALSFASDAPTSRRWLAVGASAPKPVARIAPMPTTTLRALDRAADYIIITHPDFVSALQPLVQHRQARGLRVRVATTTQVYDEFGYGVESPSAIHTFLDWIQQNWKSPAPRFVLLVGKASYDYRDFLNAPNKNLVPTFLLDTPHLRQAASDNWYVTDDADTARPTLALGRIPAKTPDQVTQAVNKMIAYESSGAADWRSRVIVAADDKDPSFQSTADLLAGKIRSGMQAQKIYLADYKGAVDPTRADLITRWNAGALIMMYIGHGSINTWAEGPLFSDDYLGEIKNGDRLPVLITPTCLDGYFYHPQVDSLTESLLFKKDGGIVAGLVPTGLSLPDSQGVLMSELFNQLFTQGATTWGEAILRAKQQTAAATPEMREIIQTFGWIGDPALALAPSR